MITLAVCPEPLYQDLLERIDTYGIGPQPDLRADLELLRLHAFILHLLYQKAGEICRQCFLVQRSAVSEILYRERLPTDELKMELLITYGKSSTSSEDDYTPSDLLNIFSLLSNQIEHAKLLAGAFASCALESRESSVEGQANRKLEAMLKHLEQGWGSVHGFISELRVMLNDCRDRVSRRFVISLTYLDS